MCACLSVCPSVCLSVCLFVCLSLSLSAFALFSTQVGGLPSFYCDICGKVYTSRDELVTHHSSVHSDSPALAGQPQETNRSSGGDSAIQEDGSALVPDNEDGESESGEKSETIADNAAQRTGSLNGTLERDRRKVNGKLSVILCGIVTTCSWR